MATATADPARTAPPGGAIRLYVLPPSHYCERARWGLEQAGIAFEEVPWTVGLHARRARRIAPATSLPILETGAGVIQGSGAILDWAGLPGGDPALEQRLEQRTGDLVRRYVYAATLGDPRSGVREALSAGVPRGEARLLGLFWPLLRRLMQQGLRARPRDLAAIEAELAQELDWFAARLGGRAHLVGEAFGRADITAASLWSPLARPPEGPPYGGIRFPAAVEATLARWSAAPALAWTRAMYARSRRRVGACTG